MVKFFESTFSHEYPFPTVTLAYFLRYPNPFSTHVVSTDVIESHFDADTQRLYTARLHLKRSKIPSAILKLLPQNLLGPSTSAATGASQSFILERSIVAIKDGVMITESRNLDLTAILTVVERQLYKRPGADPTPFFRNYNARRGFNLKVPEKYSSPFASADAAEETDVTTKVELISQLGQARARARKAWWRRDPEAAGEAESVPGEEETEPAPKMGFWRSLSTNSIQRSIEAVGLRRAQRAVPKAKEGMNVVLERMRAGGLVAVLEGMRRDRETSEWKS